MGEAFEVFLTSGSPPRSLYSQIGKARLNECPPLFFSFFFLVCFGTVACGLASTVFKSRVNNSQDADRGGVTCRKVGSIRDYCQPSPLDLNRSCDHSIVSSPSQPSQRVEVLVDHIPPSPYPTSTICALLQSSKTIAICSSSRPVGRTFGANSSSLNLVNRQVHFGLWAFVCIDRFGLCENSHRSLARDA